MSNRQKLAANLTALAMTDFLFEPRQISSFVMATCKSALGAAVTGQKDISQGMYDFVGMLFINIYDADPIKGEDKDSLDVGALMNTKKFINKMVLGKEIAAHCMAVLKLIKERQDEGASTNYLAGMFTVTAAFVEIMSEEMYKSQTTKAERNTDEG